MPTKLDFTQDLKLNGGTRPKYETAYPNGNGPQGTQHGARYVVNATGLVVSSFGTKRFQQPYIFENYEAANEGLLLKDFNGAYVPYNGSGAYITADNARYAGAKSVANSSFRAGANDFWTNYRAIPATKKVYWSYYHRVSNWIEGVDGAVLKLSRMTDFGHFGNVYNGTGASWLGGGTMGGFSSSFGGGTNYNQNSEVSYGKGAWKRYEETLKIGAADTADGFYRTVVDNQTTHTTGNKIFQTTAAPVSIDNILLGLETANPRTKYEIQNFVSGNTYSVTVNGITYSSSASTKNAVLASIAAQVCAAINSAACWTDGTYITVHNGLNASTVYGAGFVKSSFQIFTQMTSMYLDVDSSSRFVIGNNPVYGLCTIKEDQPYFRWAPNQSAFTIFAPTIVGTKYLFFVDDNDNVYALGAMKESGIHNA